MDYYSKYQKYKLKFLNLRKQIGGAIIWEYQLDNGSWLPYDPEESYFIEVNHGTFQLPITKFMVNKDLGYQQGKVNRRPIRRSEVNETEMNRIKSEFIAKKTIEILRSFPQILRLDPNMDIRIFEARCMEAFASNERTFKNTTTVPRDQYASQHCELYRDIIRRGTPLTIPAITALIEERNRRAAEERRAEEAARRSRKEEDKKFKDFPGAHF